MYIFQMMFLFWIFSARICILPSSMRVRYFFTNQNIYSIILTLLVDLISKKLLDFKLSPCYKCCMLSSGLFPGLWILCTDVSEHSVCSIFIGRWLCEEPQPHRIQTPGNNPEEIIQEATYYTPPPVLFILPPALSNIPFSQVHSVTLGPSMWGKELNSHKKPLRSLT